MDNRLLRVVFAVLNTLGVVGVGTYLAGHRKTGVVQLGISLIALATTLIPFMVFLSRANPNDQNFITWYLDLLSHKAEIPLEAWKWFLFSLAGVGLFLVNLFWSWCTTRPKDSGPPPLPR